MSKQINNHLFAAVLKNLESKKSDLYSQLLAHWEHTEKLTKGSSVDVITNIAREHTITSITLANLMENFMDTENKNEDNG